jgi:hypothetical protein
MDAHVAVVAKANDGKPRARRGPALWRVALPLTAFVVVIGLALLDAPGVRAWLYPAAWYPLLALLDAGVVVSGGRSIAERPRVLIAMLYWSAVIWFGFEALNLRLQNWYYIYVPASTWQRWIGTVVAFATVVPAIVLPARLLACRGIGDRLVTRPLGIGRFDLAAAFALGAVLLCAVLAAPTLLYPLVWGAVWLLAEPVLFRLDPEHSLFADIAAGRFGRIARLMAAGLVAGALWETLNALALTRWIYTVPLLEHIKIFEMPPLGFFGFPFFALEAWSLYHLLSRWTRWWTVGPAAVGVVATLAAMDARTFASTLPYAAHLPGVSRETARRLEAVGLADAFRIARVDPAALERVGLSGGAARRLHGVARLAALRGIGAVNAHALAAAGYGTPERLAAADPELVWHSLRRPDRHRPTAAEVRVWVRAARRDSAL